MDSTQILSLCSFALAIPQGLAAILQLKDRSRTKKTGTFALSLLGLSVLATLFLGFWLWYHPLKPVERTVVVEKTVACPPVEQKNGAATARASGGSASAHSGNGDTNYAPPASAPASTPPR
jgi:hypothetical protein